MMKPKFADVVEYVKDGQEDPEMEKMLSAHPDGQELLKQARFICKMLENEAEASDVGGMAAKFRLDVAASDRRVAQMMSAESMREPEESFAEYHSAELRAPLYRKPSIAQMIDRAGGRGEDLGTLMYEDVGERIEFSYEQSETAKSRYGEAFLSHHFRGQDKPEGLHIISKTINITVPESVAKGEPVSIRVTIGSRQRPATNKKIIFMPDSGPFEELQADNTGMLQIPGPDRPGTLRIETPILQFLHIKRKQ
jgi:hypothetical protein